MILQCINTKLTNSLNESLYKAFCYQTIKNLSNTAIPQPTQIQQNKKEPEVDAAISKSKHILGKVITRFKAPIAYAFAYGSGVFKQKGYENEKKKPLVDYVFAVDDPLEWHKINFKQFQNHYSGLGKMSHSAKILSAIQEDYGAKIYYNTFVEIENMKIKYGVISTENLKNDLYNWETLYIAGRMQKPVLTLVENAEIEKAKYSNLKNALKMAILSLPYLQTEINEKDLFLIIAGFSYQGDFRMKFGENPNKVKNIVDKQIKEFHQLYTKIMLEDEDIKLVIQPLDNNKWKINSAERILLLKDLPSNLITQLLSVYSQQISIITNVKEISTDQDLANIINGSIGNIIKGPALSQSIKGIVTAGIFKSTIYSMEKIRKSIKGRREGK
ncbi:mitochondrial matrix Mmp37 [Neocallimastix lanati (nom. inval.)]|jgi:translocator assembly and maintenance protein 41|uniref:Phosphatidate cytidylyltransferase, mitochondrial n=1 Tax=Neocallimastix californiae TaxID=1754190 RepID=A0A1Y2DZI1_9FUNG|nr:mitochondrial matrix Mmp37 [Neocallimastix sp. JGI-2020a]ORY64683.1 mitochondrial matrix Mmp37 [Neocallimastix californiae]|eukprot:ORY64683.1 mitochondrial matrix Mmp37 [Neocallimastix californiae]